MMNKNKELTMSRACLAILMLIVPAVALLTTSGCEEKTTVVRQSDTRHETEPEMVSPGDEVLE